MLLRLISQQGLGADCVSGNEIRQALECGFPADTIVYAGVGKSDAEIELALQHDIFCFNCESLPEIQVIDGIAARLGKKPGSPFASIPMSMPIPITISPQVSKKTNSVFICTIWNMSSRK